ncbi:MAG TPA: winged helix-turn-helix domain-containing protein [Steroidobacteraceae bacterium]|nr:winged helix-turn-helix domain-containing protein [Steroidobacteraceae bacterium]
MQVSTVLVVDGDRASRDALVTCLKFVGVEAHGAESAAAARFWLSTGVADVLVLSDELSDVAPADLLQHGAESTDGKASILVLTSGGISAMLANYPIDDTLRRPIALSRVVERVESLIHERTLKRGVLLRFGALSLDVANERAFVGEQEAALGHTETRLLAFFIGIPDKVFSRAQLLQRIWPANVRVEERTVDVHIRRLRLTLEKLGCAGYIQTVRGSGYRFSAF